LGENRCFLPSEAFEFIASALAASVFNSPKLAKRDQRPQVHSGLALTAGGPRTQP
jgi:hypothetical protein